MIWQVIIAVVIVLVVVVDEQINVYLDLVRKIPGALGIERKKKLEPRHK